MKFVFILSLLVSSAASAATGIGYEGRLIKPDGTPLEGANVFFHIQIRSPGAENCLLFDEQQTLNMTGSNGVFVLTIGAGTRAAPAVDGGFAMERIFGNKGVMSGLTCNIGTTYTPSVADIRKLAVQFNDGSGWQTLPPMNINHTPFAIEASQVAGYKKDQLLRVADGVTATEFSSANWTALWDLITGNSSLYAKNDGTGFAPSASVDYNGQKIIDLADPTLAQDAVTKNYSDNRVGGKLVDVTAVSNVAGDGKVLIWNQTLNKFETAVPNDSTKLPLAGGTMSGNVNMGSFSISNVGHVLTADQGTLYLGKFTSAQESTLIATPLNNTTDRGRTWFNVTSGKMRIWNGTAASDVSGSGDALVANPLSQFAATTSAQLAGLLSNETGTGLAVFGTSPTLITPSITGGFNLNGATSGGIVINVPAVGSSGTYIWPSAIPASNQVLQSDNSGNLSWVTPAGGGTVTSVTSANTDIAVATGTTTPVMTLNTGTGANQIVKLDGSSNLPAVNASALTNLNAANISSGTIADARLSSNVALKTYSDANILGMPLAAPSVGQVGQSLRWNAGNTAWEYYTPSTSDSTKLPLAGGIMTGTLNMGSNIIVNVGSPVSLTDAVNKSYVDSNLVGATLASPSPGDAGKAIRYNSGATAFEYYTPFALPGGTAGQVLRHDGANWQSVALGSSDVTGALTYTPVNRSGDTMTGLLLLSGDPSNTNGAATKQYVDSVTTTSAAAYVRKDGTSSLSGDWDINGVPGGGSYRITGLLDPTVPEGAATKNYVDTRVDNKTFIDGTAGAPSMSFTSDAGAGLFHPGAGILGFSTSSIERMRISSNGNVGIGITSPSAKLEVLRTDSATAGSVYGHKSYVEAVPSSSSGASYLNYFGVGTGNAIPQAFTGGGFKGVIGEVSHQGTGTINSARGTEGSVMNNSTGIISSAIGVYANVNNPSGTINNAYGLYVNTFGGAGSYTNKYGVYVADPSASNNFAGSVAVGTTAAAAGKLHVVANGGPVGLFEQQATTQPSIVVSNTVDTEATIVSGAGDDLRIMASNSKSLLLGNPNSSIKVDAPLVLANSASMSGNDLITASKPLALISGTLTINCVTQGVSGQSLMIVNTTLPAITFNTGQTCSAGFHNLMATTGLGSVRAMHLISDGAKWIVVNVEQ